ncbi:MAG: DNA polymerase IV [bacterium]
MILHIDMDAFFASVEQASNPELRGRPIAVAGSAKRAVIITSSYEARRFGVKTGMMVWEAKKACPHIQIVVANFEKYASTSREIMNIFRKYGVTEAFSVDEAFIDIGNQDPFLTARSIKEEIRKRFNITCSVGVGVNKDIAKLVSGINKPDGYFHVTSLDDIKDLSIKEICGIGRKNFKKLRLLAINTIEEFVNTRDEVLRNTMGIHGIRLKLALKGELTDTVNPEPVTPKSVSNSMTLPHDVWHKGEVELALFQLCEKVGFRLRRNNLWGRRVALYVRYKDFESFSLDRKYYDYTNDEIEIFERVKSLLEDIKLTKPIRLFGVTVTDLASATQATLFDNERLRRIEALDKIRERWGYGAITWGMLANKFNHKPPISPAWRPEKY